MARQLESLSSVTATPATADAETSADAALLESLLAVEPALRPAHPPKGSIAVLMELPAPSETTAGPVVLKAQERMDLINSCQGIVRSLAWKIHRKLPPNVDLDDLIAYGQVGLAQAARDFDPGIGGKFTTYAYWRVRGAILDGLSQMSWFKRQDFHASKYEGCTHAGGPAPSKLKIKPIESNNDASAVVDEPPIPPQDDETRDDAAQPLRVTSLGSDPGNGLDVSESGLTVDAASRNPPSQSMLREMMEHVRRSIELLPPEAATLIRAAYFEGVTLHEAGRRLGISRGWTSRLHARTLERLARELRSHWSGD